MTTKINPALQNFLAEYLGSNYTGANTLTIYEGTQPADGGGSASGSTVLLTYENVYFEPTAVAGVVSLDLTGGAPQALASASGTAQWGRFENGSGLIIDGAVGTSGQQFNISTTSITEDDLVSLNSCDLVFPSGS
ncbi:MAG: hypothetical protein KIS62_12485 [Ramlibacter sp.]|nr:hypothetical protein [Ramlibacter sp.]MCW5650556.1 hypothetical protein [Ramlibacter sp.]